MPSTSFHFTKMHGLGNDFVIVNATDHPLVLSSPLIAQLGHRHTGIGFDQLLMIEPSQQADFFCRIFNADGSEAEQCGNGLRCVARFVHEKKLQTSSHLRIETRAGVFPVMIRDYDHIRVTMGVPQIQEKYIELKIAEKLFRLSVLSLGNPHAIIKIESIAAVPVLDWGTAISEHHFFPQGANVGFMQIITPQHIRLRAFERGVGETYACGSNACAAVAAGILNGWLDHRVKVEFKLGYLEIEWAGEDKPLQMTGPAVRVFEGNYHRT